MSISSTVNMGTIVMGTGASGKPKKKKKEREERQGVIKLHFTDRNY